MDTSLNFWSGRCVLISMSYVSILLILIIYLSNYLFEGAQLKYIFKWIWPNISCNLGHNALPFVETFRLDFHSSCTDSMVWRVWRVWFKAHLTLGYLNWLMYSVISNQQSSVVTVPIVFSDLLWCAYMVSMSPIPSFDDNNSVIINLPRGNIILSNFSTK